MGIFMGMASDYTLSPEILVLITELDEFKGRWTTTQGLAPERLTALRQIATIESIGSSTRIEGVKLEDAEIEALLSGVKTFLFRSRDEQEIAGYAEVMELVFSSYSEIKLTENHIKQLHSVLLKYSSKDTRHRREYKKFPNNVEAFDPTGKSLGIVFETATPFDTPGKMQKLIEWALNQFETKELHSLLIISIFIVTFLAIHPFQDGNGRLSRILTTFLLLKSGYTYVPYSSLEKVIEENKKNYYLSLRKAQGTLYKDNSQINEWILFFLRSMRSQKNTLLKKLEGEELLAKLPKLSFQIVEIIKLSGANSIGELFDKTQKNRNTIKLHLKKLVQLEYLTQEGQGKGTRYRVKSLLNLSKL